MKNFSNPLPFYLCLLLLQPLSLAAAALPRAINLVSEGHHLPASSYSILVQEVGQDQALLKFNEDTPRNPASTIKVLTTLAALEELGPAYLWPTEVYALGQVSEGVLHGDLLLKGYGDPYLVTENLWKLLQQLHRMGISEIQGDLLIDDSYFAAPDTDPGEFDNKPERSYNVLPNALLVNFKAASFHFFPANDGRSVVIKSDPELPNLVMENNLRLGEGRCGGFQRGIGIRVPGSPRLDRVIFDGSYPASCGHYVMSRTVLTPQGFAFGVFSTLWRQMGGTLAGTVKKGLAPAGQEPFLTWHSPPLGELIRLVNKFSNNVMTRQILLTLAAQTVGAPASEANGRKVLREYLAQRGMDTSSLNVVNGAGLSRDTRVSARLMADILLYADSIAFMPEFVASLSIMGMDGTARHRLRKTIKSGHAHIKTGTIDDVSAIAGYVDAVSGKRFVVAAMLNHDKAHRGPGEELMNAIVAWTYRQ